MIISSHFYPMRNVIQDYAWGSPTSIGQLFGTENPQGKPQAEIWMGAHQNGCSTIEVEGQPILLSEFIAANKETVIGAETAERFGELPYLFKVLAAEKALSIQVHPSKAQAEVGYAKEEQMGIDQTAGCRNYKDPNHKPELVYALTPYQAMNGFREYADIVAFFRSLKIAELASLVDELAVNQNETGLKTFFTAMLSLEGEVKERSLAGLLAYANANQEEELFALILQLADQHPGDIGLFAPLILNTVTLQPGEAMFLDACTPHAYIKGTGLEIMANSDNVLRAGLTPKYMDVPELVSCTCCVPISADTLRLTPNTEQGSEHYPIPVADFKFSVYQQSYDQLLRTKGAEILFAVDAPLTLAHADGENVTIEKGQSVFVPANAGSYLATSAGKFARAYN